MMKIGIFIGRFQPLHKGHLSVIRSVLKEVDKLIIAIGSSEESFTKNNPFTISERTDMIKKTLISEKISLSKCPIIPIPDINNCSRWVGHVEKLTPDFDIVYTGSTLTKSLFKKYSNHNIKDVKKIIKISSTEIRKLMLEDKGWKKKIHPATIKFLDKIDAVKRIKEIYKD